MNPSETNMLSQTLKERSQDVGGHPISLDDVRGTARGIRRRRTALKTAAAAVVTAVVAPGAFLAGGWLTTADGPSRDQQFAGPSSGPTAGPDNQALVFPDKPVTLTLDGLPEGEEPEKLYYQFSDGNQLVTPDGTFRPEPNLQQVTRYDGGWLGVGYHGEGHQVFFLDEGFGVKAAQPTGIGLATNADGSRVAYVVTEEDKSQTLVSAPADGTDPVTWRLPELPVVSPVGFLDRDTVVYQTEGTRPAVHVARTGGETERLDGLMTAADASDVTGLVAGMTSATDYGSCSAVIDPSTGQTLWETCDYSFTSFSPDGRFLLAGPAYRDGLGDRTAAVLDAQTGEVLVEYTQPRDGQLALTRVLWEDNRHLVGAAADGNRWSILRLGLDGTVERTVEERTQGPNEDYSYWIVEAR